MLHASILVIAMLLALHTDTAGEQATIVIIYIQYHVATWKDIFKSEIYHKLIIEHGSIVSHLYLMLPFFGI